MNAGDLRAKRKAVEHRHDEATRVRLHRAISWLMRAEQESEDPDAQFVFLWISFNAAYAQELGPGLGEREQLTAFFRLLVEADREKRLHSILFDKFSGPIRTLVENRFVFEPFWRALREHDSSNNWESQFAASKRAALHAIISGDTIKVLGIVFDRLYVLRNQLVHGGSTWNSAVNRAQVRDGATIVRTILPVIIDLMLDRADATFGPINYPVVQ